MQTKIRLRKAQLREDHDILGKQDPYAIFQMDGETKKSRVCESGGLNPEWKEQVITLTKQMPILIVKLYDEDVISDDFIGYGEKDLTEIDSNNLIKINLMDNNREPAGNVSIQLLSGPYYRHQDNE